MTTFTSEDRISSAQYFTDPGIISDPPQGGGFFAQNPWPNPWFTAHLQTKDLYQTEIPFFWPLTEQIPLDLDYGPSDLLGESYRSSKYTTIKEGTTGFTWGTTTVTNIAPSLSVKPTNSVAQLNIGGIEIGLEKQPKWYHKVLYKLLGFNWKDLK